ncbi:pyridoxamine 5'-phosphate oxidase family protein [Streptomyces sp. NPDC050095]|uniref:pyridoxamine 5'-phosphate oxidase family protein n=1 Tax=unclassified Streptomyces TaxID=2593676 RepID=UPI0034238D0C
MNKAAPARPAKQRKQDTLDRLERDVDAWVATAAEDGQPYLMPLSFLWRDGVLYLSTRATNPLARNLLATGTAHLAIGGTRDVVRVEGVGEALGDDEISQEFGDAFAAKTGFDPRAIDQRYLYFRVRPVLIQAWREVNELADRDVMREGRWLVED